MASLWCRCVLVSWDGVCGEWACWNGAKDLFPIALPNQPRMHPYIYVHSYRYALSLPPSQPLSPTSTCTTCVAWMSGWLAAIHAALNILKKITHPKSNYISSPQPHSTSITTSTFASTFASTFTTICTWLFTFISNLERKFFQPPHNPRSWSRCASE